MCTKEGALARCLQAPEAGGAMGVAWHESSASSFSFLQFLCHLLMLKLDIKQS